MDVADHQIIGAPLYLTAKEGTNITMEALNGGQIVMHSPIKMAGPIIPRNLEYQVKGDSSSGGEVAMVHVVGTVKVQNLQFDLVETERPEQSPQPGMLCTYATVRARAPIPWPLLAFVCIVSHSLVCCVQTGRHGWVRLTQDAPHTCPAGQTPLPGSSTCQNYHLYICTVNGWKPITSTGD